MCVLFFGLPVAGKAIVAFRAECSCRGKHDGGVQICNDSADGTGGVDTGLGAAWAGLESCQDKGDLFTDTPRVVLKVSASESIMRVALNFPSILYQLHTAFTEILNSGTDSVCNLNVQDYST